MPIDVNPTGKPDPVNLTVRDALRAREQLIIGGVLASVLPSFQLHRSRWQRVPRPRCKPRQRPYEDIVGFHRFRFR